MEDDGVEWFDKPGSEAVEVSAPRAKWVALGARWVAAIEAVVTGGVRVEHIGSTSVPQLPAKPVIDLQLSVADLEDEQSYRPALESLGLVLRQREADHRFFRPPAGEPRTVHVHVCAAGSRWEDDHLQFRNVLRRRPDLADEYARLKASLARQFRYDRASYNSGKSDFIAEAIPSTEE
ncbi:GrpB family protein [Amnibacterium soli]|uniref:GrpB family protein n=1 Tax=Amnibacterium soli TaxID=1282736 RepID=A0ABP8ZFK6_9MICO